MKTKKEKIPEGWRKLKAENTELTVEQIYAHLMEIYVNRYESIPPQVNDMFAPKYNDGNGTAGDPNFGKSTTT